MAYKILVIKLGALGDFIQAFGAMKAIRHHHPDSTITLLTTAPFKELASKSGYFDNIWLDKRPKLTNPYSWLSLRKKLNNGRFQRVYDLQNNDRTCLYFRLFNSKPEWVGIAKGASHRNTSPERTAGNALAGHIQTLALAGISNITLDDLAWMDTDIYKFSLPSRYALIVPGCAPSHPEKQWPATSFAAIATFLTEQDITPVIIGTKAEAAQAKAIKTACPIAISLLSKTDITDIATLARNAVCAIGNDTGPMHIIGATGCKSLVLFSEHSNPKRHAPLGEQVHFLQENNLENLTPTVVRKEMEKIVFLET